MFIFLSALHIRLHYEHLVLENTGLLIAFLSVHESCTGHANAKGLARIQQRNMHAVDQLRRRHQMLTFIARARILTMLLTLAHVQSAHLKQNNERGLQCAVPASSFCSCAPNNGTRGADGDAAAALTSLSPSFPNCSHTERQVVLGMPTDCPQLSLHTRSRSAAALCGCSQL